MEVLNRSFCFFFFFLPPFSSEKDQRGSELENRGPRHRLRVAPTWLNGRLRRRSGPGAQLQQGLLKGLAEGVLEVGNRDAVGAVALSVAVGRWRSQQLVCKAAQTHQDTG